MRERQSRKYRKVSARLWNDPRFRSLSLPGPSGQFLYWFLRTGPQASIVPGLFEARAPGLADRLGWSVDDFKREFKSLSSTSPPLALADWDAGLVWIPDAVDDDRPQSVNTVKSWQNSWDELPDCELKLEAYQALRNCMSHAMSHAFAEACRRPCNTQTQTQTQTHRAMRGDARTREAQAQAREEKPRQAGVDHSRLREALVAAKGKKSTGRPAPVDDSPSNPELFGLRFKDRSKLIRFLESEYAKGADLRRQRTLLAKIEDEVVRVYRAARWRATGNDYVKLGEAGRKAARAIGVACVGHGLAPEQVVAYWQDPENNFTNMAFPSLSFMGGEKNIERAAAALKPARAGRSTAARRGHSYDDGGELHPRLREALVEAGLLEVARSTTNRELMTVQNAALAVLEGRDPGMSHFLRRQAEAVVHLFKEGG